MDTVVTTNKKIDGKFYAAIEIKSSSEAKVQAFLSLAIECDALYTYAKSYVVHATNDQPAYSRCFDPLLYQEIQRIEGVVAPDVRVGEKLGVKWGKSFFFSTDNYEKVFLLLQLLQERLPGVSQSAIETLLHRIYSTLSAQKLFSHVKTLVHQEHIDEAIDAAKHQHRVLYQNKAFHDESVMWLLAMQLETSGFIEYAKKAYMSIEYTDARYEDAQFRIARLMPVDNDTGIIERFTALMHGGEQAIAVLDQSFIANVVTIMPEEQLKDLILSPKTETNLKIHLAQLLFECGHVLLTRALYEVITKQSTDPALLGDIHYKMAVLLKEFFPAEPFLFYQHCLSSNRYVPNEPVITLLKDRMGKETSKENIADFIADCLRLSLKFEECLYHAGTVLIQYNYALLAYGFFELIKPCKAKAGETFSLFENARHSMAILIPAISYNIKLTQIVGTVLRLCIDSGSARIYSSVCANYEVLTRNVAGMNKALFSLRSHEETPLMANSLWRQKDFDGADSLQQAFLSRPTVI